MLSVHGSFLVACVLDVIGAYFMNPWLLLPYIIIDVIRLSLTCWLFCIVLITIKRAVNLGVLIMYAILLSFVMFVLLYLWGCVFSLFHAIFIVRTKSYRSVFGDDPLALPPKSILNKSNEKAKVERVKFYPSPNFNTEADKLKPVVEVNKSVAHPFGVRQSRRIKNDYVNELSVGHG
ncbi:uncharacterized protein LOC129573187 [Sitodiplosis mosellana]|uniref:uncharacterized protein LOC129573187 n=1 Tax=Sitodiplosis mosellana TaxID=263140 RepID=UPI002444E9F3|nr:uncharacterized protein LOC129573187 [Sitodiplosis mosellana]